MLFIKYCVVCFKSFLDQRKKLISLCTEEEKKNQNQIKTNKSKLCILKPSLKHNMCV